MLRAICILIVIILITTPPCKLEYDESFGKSNAIDTEVIEALFDWDKLFSDQRLFASNESLCLKAIKNAWNQNMTSRYVDASGKPGAGIMKGNIFWLGDYDECMKIKDSHYCTLFILKLGGHPIVEGVCAPKDCGAEDIKEIFQFIQNVTSGLSKKPIIEVGDNPLVHFYGGRSMFCSEKKDFNLHETTAETIVAVVFMVIAFLCIVGTAVDMSKELFQMLNYEDIRGARNDVDVDLQPGGTIQRQSSEDSNRNQDNITDFRPFVIRTRGARLVNFLQCFSLTRTTAQLSSTEISVSSGLISSLPGIRVFSLLWVMMGHLLIYAPQFAPIANFLDLQGPWMERFSMQALLNSALAVDTFLLMSGLLAIYHGWERIETLNLKRFIFHRILRIMPVYLFLLLFYTFIFPFLSSGPYWFAHAHKSIEMERCKKYWWTNVIYINDFYPDVEDGCFKWSWYLAVDMQFYLISAIFIWCMKKCFRNEKYGVYGLNGLAIGVSMLTNGILIYHLKATPIFTVGTFKTFITNPRGSPLYAYMNNMYTRPYTRFTPYSVGLVLGYFILRGKRYRGQYPKVFHGVGWLLAVSIASLIVYLPLTRNHSEWYLVDNLIYGVLFRLGWSTSVAWVIYACHFNFGGLVNELLSWKGFIPVSRLTYSAYLSHVLVLFLYFGSLHTPMYLNDLTLAFLYSGIVLVTFVLAYFIAVFIEIPVFNLEKLFFRE